MIISGLISDLCTTRALLSWESPVVSLTVQGGVTLHVSLYELAPLVSLLLHPSFTEMTAIDGDHMGLIQIVRRKTTFSHWGTLQLLLQQTLVYPSRLFDTQPGQKWFCLKLQLWGGKIESWTKAIIIARMVWREPCHPLPSCSASQRRIHWSWNIQKTRPPSIKKTENTTTKAALAMLKCQFVGT